MYILTIHKLANQNKLVHIFRTKDLIEDKSNKDDTEDIIGVEIVSIEELKI